MTNLPPAPFVLRPFQQAALSAIYESWKQYRKVLLACPTGSGKTIIFSKVAEKESIAGNRTLILCHRDELIRQARDKIRMTTGLDCAIEKAEETATGSLLRIVVGSIQTLMRTSRLEKFAPDQFQTIIADECHHVMSESWQKVLNYFSSARVCGVSATPERSDRKNLGQFFDAIAYEYSLRQAIHDGYLCRIVAQTHPLKIDLSAVRITQGDFNENDLGNALDPYLPLIAKAIPVDRKTLIFTPLCVTAQKLQAILRSAGRRAYYASGEDRSQIKTWEEDNAGSVMLNSQLLNEGYDHALINCVVVLRATRSRPYWCQMVGRGTRIKPDGGNLLVLDFLWQTERHDLCHPCNLLASTPEVAAKMQKRQEESDSPVDLELLEEGAKQDVICEREEALARELKEQRYKKSRLIDPLKYAITIKDESLLDYEPVFSWEEALPTPNQLQLLTRFGINAERVKTRGFAAHLITNLLGRSRKQMATPKQARVLSDAGYWTTDMTKAEANAKINELSENYWRLKSTPLRKKQHVGTN